MGAFRKETKTKLFGFDVRSCFQVERKEALERDQQIRQALQLKQRATLGSENAMECMDQCMASWPLFKDFKAQAWWLFLWIYLRVVLRLQQAMQQNEQEGISKKDLIGRWWAEQPVDSASSPARFKMSFELVAINLKS